MKKIFSNCLDLLYWLIIEIVFVEPKENEAPVAVIKPTILKIKEDTTGILDGAGEMSIVLSAD